MDTGALQRFPPSPRALEMENLASLPQSSSRAVLPRHVTLPMHQRARIRDLPARSAVSSMHREVGDAKLIQELAFLAPFGTCTLHPSRQSARLITCFCAEAEDAKLLDNLDSEMSSEQDIIEPDQLVKIKVGNSFFSPEEFYGDDKLHQELGLSSGGTLRPDLEHIRNWERLSATEVYVDGRVYNTRDVKLQMLRGANFKRNMDACSKMLQRLQGSLSDPQQAMTDVSTEDTDVLFGKDTDIVFEKDNDFYRPLDFKTDADLQRRLSQIDGGPLINVHMDDVNGRFCIPWYLPVAVDSSMLLQVVEKRDPSSRDLARARGARRLFGESGLDFVACESALVEVLNALGGARFRLAGTYPSRLLWRRNPRSGFWEHGEGFTLVEYEYNQEVAMKAFMWIVESTRSWTFARSPGNFDGVLSIAEMRKREGCQTFDARIVQEAWEFCNVMLTCDHHKVILTGKREGITRYMICINPLIMPITRLV